MRRRADQQKWKVEKFDDLSFRRPTDIFSVYFLYRTLPPSRIGNDSSSNCVCGLFSSRLVLDIYRRASFFLDRDVQVNSRLASEIGKSIHSHGFLCLLSYKMYQLSTQNEAVFFVLHTNKTRSSCRLRYLFILCIYLVYEFLRYSIPCHIIVPHPFCRMGGKFLHKMVWTCCT